MLQKSAIAVTAILLGNKINVDSKELKQLIFLWRHGDRSPVRQYPEYEKQFDKKFEEMWPHGPGQLTVHGMKQHYELGNYLHNTYKDFIPENFNPNDIYIRSTDVDRTLMSAQANAAAMFQDQDRTDSGITPVGMETPLFDQWMPLPIHTVPRSDEEILSFPVRESRCPKWHEYAKAARETPKFLEYQRKYGDFLADIRVKGGFNEPFGLADEWEFFDPIYCTYVHNFTMPDWFSTDMLKELEEIWSLGAYALFSDFENNLHEKMTRLGAGNLIKQLQTDMKQVLKIDHSRNKRGTLVSSLKHSLKDGPDGGDPLLPHKLRIYSAHDTTIVALLVALKQYNFKQPPYASALIFEVYDDESIVFKYRNETDHEAYTLRLCDTEGECKFDDFVADKAHLISDNWAAECESKHISPATHASSTLLLTTLLLGTWFGMVIFYIYNRIQNRDNLPYENIDTGMETGIH